MGLNTFDPIIDFGKEVRLTLSAAGQLACPIQALWILGAVGPKIDSMLNARSFSPDAQIQAYRSWILMRCRQVWNVAIDPIQDPKLLSMMGFWQELKDLSMAELVFPLRWEGMALPLLRPFWIFLFAFMKTRFHLKLPIARCLKLRIPLFLIHQGLLMT